MTLLSRRATFSGLAAVACTRPVSAQSIGPDATLYGAPDYPLPPRELARREGNPWSPKYRVGAFTHLDEIYETRKVARAAEPWPFKHAAASQPVSFVTEYLARNPVMGLLVAKDDRILIEQYQYGRTDRDRFVSQSMVKSITSLLVGLAIADGAIRSVDDTPDMYVPGFKGSEYGRTPLRALLHMSSGVDFGEERDGGADLNRLWRGLVGGMPRKDTIGSIVQFDRRIAPPGRRYHYASIEPDVLGVVVRQTTGRSMAGYLQEKIWQPIGAESDATWLLDAEGGELAHFGFSAVLRDYARLGRLLAHDGAWNGKQLISAQWLHDATTVERPEDAYLAPGSATKDAGYGYLFWLLPGTRRQFAMFGAFGQRIIVDPPSKLVMVQTALDDKGQWPALWRTLVTQFG